MSANSAAETQRFRENVPIGRSWIRCNALSEGDPHGWSVRCILPLASLGEEPASPCQKDAGMPVSYWCEISRFPCDACQERLDWRYDVFKVCSRTTGMGFQAFGGTPGHAFAFEPEIRVAHGCIVVTWSGGFDV